MASNYDIAFLRVLMQQSLAEKSQAMRCIQVIDEQAQKGKAVSAMQVVVTLGLCDPRAAERVDAITREELQRTGGSSTGRHQVQSDASGTGPLPSGAHQLTAQSGVAALPGRPPGPPPPLAGPLGSSSLVKPAGSASGTLPPPPRSTAQSGVVRTAQSGAGALAPQPGGAGAPLERASGGFPAAHPAGFAAPPPRPAPLPAGSHTGRLSRAALAEAPPPPAAEAAGEEFYDLAENGRGLDDFTSGPKVGRGPAGTSYTGRRKSDGARVVVKVLSRRFEEHPELLQQVLGDLEAWTRFRHPSVAATLALGESNGRRVVVYEEARGAPLTQHLRDKGRLEPRAAVRVVYDLAGALAAAQERGLAHGDVRAAKVFHDGQRAVLIDPGLARASCLAAGFGQHGLFFGHPSYLAPEALQERLERPTPATDVYALGVLFYELVCGTLPFEGDVVDVLGKHFDAPLPPPPQGVAFSAAIAGLMLRMTAKSPSQRLPDARAVVTAITNLLEGKPLVPPPARPSGHVAAISADDWGRVSQREEHKATSNNWTLSKIEQAPALGPADLLEAAPLSEIQSSGLRTTPSPVTASAAGRLGREVHVDEVSAIAQDPGGPRVAEKLGRGPVGTSYDGGLPGHAGPVVVKVLSKKFSKHPDLVRRILEAVKAGARVDNPGVVRALKAMQIAGRDMIVFDKAAGRTLREHLARGPLPWRQATARVLELARTLEAARRAGVSHGDVRPEKVIVQEEGGRARLCDFGLAEAAALGAGYGAAGVPFGHPTYLAPEVVQERRREPDERSDVYALGILFYELVCGRPPFQAADARRTLVMHFEEPIPPPPDGVTVPAGVAELILRMTAKDPARRPSLVDAVARLQELEGGASRDSQDGLISVSSERERRPVTAPSATGLLDYDPDQDEMVSPDAWGEQSLGLSKPSGEWVRAKATEAPKVGPEEWTPEQSDGPDEQSEPPRLAARKDAKASVPPGAPAAQKASLAAAIEAAAATRESTPDAAAPLAGGESSRATKKRVVAAAGAAPPRAAAEGGNKKQLVLALAGVAVVVVVMGVLVARDRGSSANASTSTSTSTSTDVAPQPAPATDDPALKQRQELLRRVEKEVAALAAEVEDLVRSQRFKEATDRLAALSADARREASLKDQVAAIEARLAAGVTERLARETAEIDRLLASQQFDQAERAAGLVLTWAPDPALAQAAQLRVKEARAAWHKPVAELDAGQLDPQATEGALGELLQGWREGGQLFPRGGLVLDWKKPDVLMADLQVLGGRAALEAMPDGRQGIRVVGTREAPALVVVKLPLKRIVDAAVDVVLTQEPGGMAQVALVMGVRPPAQVRGFGAAWGVVPVELLSPRDRLKMMRTAPPGALPLQKDVRLRLLMTGSGRLDMQGRLRIGADEQAGPTVPVDGGRTAGRLALWVEDAEVWVTGLELRGLLDPAGLR